MQLNYAFKLHGGIKTKLWLSKTSVIAFEFCNNFNSKSSKLYAPDRFNKRLNHEGLSLH